MQGRTARRARQHPANPVPSCPGPAPRSVPTTQGGIGARQVVAILGAHPRRHLEIRLSVDVWVAELHSVHADGAAERFRAVDVDVQRCVPGLVRCPLLGRLIAVRARRRVEGIEPERQVRRAVTRQDGVPARHDDRVGEQRDSDVVLSWQQHLGIDHEQSAIRSSRPGPTSRISADSSSETSGPAAIRLRMSASLALNYSESSRRSPENDWIADACSLTVADTARPSRSRSSVCGRFSPAVRMNSEVVSSSCCN
jgi:hypothetical protein